MSMLKVKITALALIVLSLMGTAQMVLNQCFCCQEMEDVSFTEKEFSCCSSENYCAKNEGEKNCCSDRELIFDPFDYIQSENQTVNQQFAVLQRTRSSLYFNPSNTDTKNLDLPKPFLRQVSVQIRFGVFRI